MRQVCFRCGQGRVAHVRRVVEEWLLDRGVSVPKHEHYLACFHWTH